MVYYRSYAMLSSDCSYFYWIAWMRYYETVGSAEPAPTRSGSVDPAGSVVMPAGGSCLSRGAVGARMED